MHIKDISPKVIPINFSTILILPTLTPNLERCIYFKVKNPETFKIQQIYCICTIIEFLRYYDHSSSLIVLFDWEGTKLDMMKQLDISVIQKLYNLIVVRLEQFHKVIYVVEHLHLFSF